MPSIPIPPNENLGGSLVPSLGAFPESHCQIMEGFPFRRHLILRSRRQDMPDFTFQGPMICDGTPLETFHDILIQSAHVNGCHVGCLERMKA